MTGSELKTALAAAIRAVLPEVTVKENFSGWMSRKVKAPVVCIGVLKEERGAGMCTAELGVWLYVREAADTAALFEAVCGALSGLPCAIRRISREEMKYDETLGCMATACRAEVESAAANGKNAGMRFGDFVFDGVPETLEVKRRGNMPETVLADGRTQAEYTGGGRREVAGTGVFFGDDAAARYVELEKYFGREDTLFLPGMKPFAAVLSVLIMTEPVTAGCVRFRFGFEETAEETNSLSGRTYLAAEGESLWDYAEKSGVSINALVRANPQIGCINALKAGEEVHIP